MLIHRVGAFGHSQLAVSQMKFNIHFLLRCCCCCVCTSKRCRKYNRNFPFAYILIILHVILPWIWSIAFFCWQRIFFVSPDFAFRFSFFIVNICHSCCHFYEFAFSFRLFSIFPSIVPCFFVVVVVDILPSPK